MVSAVSMNSKSKAIWPLDSGTLRRLTMPRSLVSYRGQYTDYRKHRYLSPSSVRSSATWRGHRPSRQRRAKTCHGMANPSRRAAARSRRAAARSRRAPSRSHRGTHTSTSLVNAGRAGRSASRPPHERQVIVGMQPPHEFLGKRGALTAIQEDGARDRERTLKRTDGLAH